jgi:hypothetical protein
VSLLPTLLPSLSESVSAASEIHANTWGAGLGIEDYWRAGNLSVIRVGFGVWVVRHRRDQCFQRETEFVSATSEIHANTYRGTSLIRNFNPPRTAIGP